MEEKHFCEDEEEEEAPPTGHVINREATENTGTRKVTKSNEKWTKNFKEKFSNFLARNSRKLAVEL